MKISEINYLTKDPSPQYAKDIYMCLSRAELLNKLEFGGYVELCSDAIKVIKEMKGDEFPAFREGLKKERKGEFAGVEFSEKYADVLMPKMLFEASMVAAQYKVPWGLAFIRVQEKKDNANQ